MQSPATEFSRVTSRTVRYTRRTTATESAKKEKNGHLRMPDGLACQHRMVRHVNVGRSIVYRMTTAEKKFKTTGEAIQHAERSVIYTPDGLVFTMFV